MEKTRMTKDERRRGKNGRDGCILGRMRASGVAEQEGFSHHAGHGLLGIEPSDLGDGHPRELFGFVFRTDERRGGIGLKHETHVEVPVGGIGFTRRYPVPVHVKNLRANRSQAREAAFLGAFAQGDAKQIAIAVGVAAELEPFVQFQVMREQSALTLRVHDPGRAGEVAGYTGTQQAIRFGGDETNHLRRHFGFVRFKSAGGVAVEQIENGFAVHDQRKLTRAR